jgi:hypothetical protein
MRRFAGGRGAPKFGFNSGLAENAARLIQLPHAASAACRGIDDQHRVARFRGHLIDSIRSEPNSLKEH